VLTFEGKAISRGFESAKVTEIIADHARICDWRLLDPTGRPIFFSLEPPQSVMGVLAVLLTENTIQEPEVPPESLSYWWASLSGNPLGVPQKKAEALERILRSSMKRGVVRCPIPLGNAKLSVAYAIFSCQDVPPQQVAEAAEEERTAEHEAAHAVVALLCGFKVDRIALHVSGELRGGVYCDWKASRGTTHDEDLLERAFAVAYAGSIMEMNRSGKGIGETLEELPTDVDGIEDVRKTAVDWAVVSDLVETAKLSERGMQLATAIIQANEDLIAHLADELLLQRELNQDSIEAWFEEYRNR